ncbi:hypothetical protein CPB84DRAFT_1716930 [Gymnopilus junonius]|uniref:Uncharacterized protein n=1 Tax=Gymnopilus junonius TaxID=109634 RepID=A0A9P5TG70_GYMJU|nr:hypothetical protein CPB84DRAFT_1716930 [Gymnopilus junonius]
MRPPTPPSFLWIFSFANFICLLYSLRKWSYSTEEQLSRTDNYPIEFSQALTFDTVAMTILRDTTHFQMDLKDRISRLEWTSLSDHPFVVHIGNDDRAFQVALFHQLHCVHVMEEAFLRGEYRGLNSHHIQHCLNYLRQSFICMADDSLENGDFTETWEATDRNGGNKVCRDWMGVSAAVRGNLQEWLDRNRSRSQ